MAEARTRSDPFRLYLRHEVAEPMKYYADGSELDQAGTAPCVALPERRQGGNVRVISKISTASLCLFIAAAPRLSEAHHSSARFMQDDVTTIDGTVIEFEWKMPHVYLTVRDRQGREWLIETDGPPILARSGWTRDSFAAGDSVSAKVHPSRTPEDRHALLVLIRAADGRRLDSLNRAGRENEVVSASTSTFEGIWTSDRAQTFSFMQAWQDHPLTEKGRQALAEYDPSLAESAECMPWPTPFLMASNYWYLNELILSEEKLVIRSEFYGAQRTIWLDGRQHPEDGPRTVQGHSVGRWENDSLVVDTTLFTENRSPVAQIGIPSGIQKHVTERLTLSEDGSKMFIDVVMEDPEFLAEPLSARFTWTYAPDYEMIDTPCDLESAKRFLE